MCLFHSGAALQVRELVVVTLLRIAEASQGFDPRWVFNKRKRVSLDLRCDGKDMKKLLKLLSLTLESGWVGHNFSN